MAYQSYFIASDFQVSLQEADEKTKKGNVDGGVKKNVGVFSFGKSKKKYEYLLA